MTRRTLPRVLLVALSLAALLALLEIPAYLRWVDWSGLVGLPHALRFTHLKPWDNPANVRDEELLYRHRPGLRFQGETPGDLVDLYGIATDRRYAVDVAYDENGFRNPPGRTRAEIVLVGDSFVEAGLVPFEDTLGARLERDLGVPVLNLGGSGYGPQQERIALERYGLPAKPRCVAWFFFEGNDLADVGRYEEARRTGGQDPTRTRFLARSLTANLWRRAVLAIGRPRHGDAPEAVARRGVLRRGGGALYFAFAGGPLTDEDRGHLARAEAEIREAARASREAGAMFVLVFVPTKFRVYGPLVDFPAGSPCASWTANELPELLEAFARDEGLRYVAGDRLLRERGEAGEVAYFPDDGHWNATGNAILAQAVAEACR
jgi:hypothetical protein